MMTENGQNEIIEILSQAGKKAALRLMWMLSRISLGTHFENTGSERIDIHCAIRQEQTPEGTPKGPYAMHGLVGNRRSEETYIIFFSDTVLLAKAVRQVRMEEWDLRERRYMSTNVYRSILWLPQELKEVYGWFLKDEESKEAARLRYLAEILPPPLPPLPSPPQQDPVQRQRIQAWYVVRYG
jgi:hypothetical protein